jgi:hypothetical protein
MRVQRAETDFFSGEPLAALSTLVYSQNIDLQRSASLTFAEITERGRQSEAPLEHTTQVLTARRIQMFVPSIGTPSSPSSSFWRAQISKYSGQRQPRWAILR